MLSRVPATSQLSKSFFLPQSQAPFQALGTKGTKQSSCPRGTYTLDRKTDQKQTDIY